MIIKRVFIITGLLFLWGCRAQVENEAPVAVFSTANGGSSDLLEVQLDASASYDSDGSISAYSWDLGDGNTASGERVTHGYASAANYEITLTVTDSEGASSSSTQTFSAGNLYSVSGVIRAQSNIAVDGDVNDPNAPYFDNNGVEETDVQTLQAPVLVNGFLTYFPTNVPGDAFELKDDWDDVYRANLRQGDFVSLRVLQYFAADLDLYLLDGQTLDLVGYSASYGEFESIQIPADGEYVVLVSSITGTSTYLLKIGQTSLALPESAQGQMANFEPHEFIITTEEPTDEDSTVARSQLHMSHKRSHLRPALARLNRLNPQTQAELGMQSATVSKRFRSLARKNARSADKVETLRLMKRLVERKDIKAVELNYRVDTMLTPNDPLFEFQWHHEDLNSALAWDFSIGDEDVIVAVVDSGVFSSHPDLGSCLVDGYDFISEASLSNDGDGIDSDPEDLGDPLFTGGAAYHGTHVAGVVAATLNNQEGGVGVAPGVKIMPIRTIGVGGGFSYDVLQAVRYAAGMENDSGKLPAKPADVINLSLGGGGFSFAGEELYRQVREQGIFVVAAAGNQNSGLSLYPASYDGVISVAATDLSGKRAPYSNYGPAVDVSAPGGNTEEDNNFDSWPDGILSAGVQETFGIQDPGYVYYQGTSMATPVVSGVIALMKSVYPQLTPDLFDALLASGEITADKGIIDRDDLYGYGSIDALKAVQAASELASGRQVAALVPSQSTLNFDEFIDSQVLSVRSVGNTLIDVASVSASEPWISLEPTTISDNASAGWVVRTQAESLEAGVQQGIIEVVASNGQRLTVIVNLRLGTGDGPGDAGFIYVYLLDAQQDRVWDRLDVNSENGLYAYEFNNVPAGDYYIMAGSDIDNDSYLCMEAESCGSYPSRNQIEKIEVDQNQSGIDFTVGIFEQIFLQSF